MIAKHMATFLWVHREHHKLSRFKVAEKINTAPSTISLLEHDGVVNIKLASALCEHYGLLLSTVVLFGETALVEGFEYALELENPDLLPTYKKIYAKYNQPKTGSPQLSEGKGQHSTCVNGRNLSTRA
jgi:transcriptional regulator with XRE-family HTH domain